MDYLKTDTPFNTKFFDCDFVFILMDCNITSEVDKVAFKK